MFFFPPFVEMISGGFSYIKPAILQPSLYKIRFFSTFFILDFTPSLLLYNFAMSINKTLIYKELQKQLKVKLK